MTDDDLLARVDARLNAEPAIYSDEDGIEFSADGSLIFDLRTVLRARDTELAAARAEIERLVAENKQLLTELASVASAATPEEEPDQ